MEDLISVIIPVGKDLDEAYVQRALEGINSGTAEIVIVSDFGRGVSATRNSGIVRARGEYIFFLDADDYLMPGALDALYAHRFEADLIVGGVFRQASDGTVCKLTPPADTAGCLSRNDITRNVTKYLETGDNYFVSHCWGRLYKRSILLRNRIFFHEGMEIGEDGSFNIRYLSCIDSAYIVNRPLYCFQMRSGSATFKATDAILSRDLARLETDIQGYFNGAVSTFIETLKIKTAEYRNRNSGTGPAKVSPRVRKELRYG